MMRKHLSFVAVTVLTVIVVSGDRAQASPFALKQDNVIEILKPNKPNETPQPKKQTPTKHKVKSGDSLTKIAKTYNSSVQRLFDKNKNISNPDSIKVNQVIVIPSKGEKLKHRRITAVYSKAPAQPARIAQTGNSAGNTYSYGYCTWHVKNLRPDIPNSWGNADTWDDYAPSSGYTVGSTPKAGAIGVTRAYMHVVYVLKVNKDGTVLISEMNYQGWNVASQRVAPASEFNYIY